MKLNEMRAALRIAEARAEEEARRAHLEQQAAMQGLSVPELLELRATRKMLETRKRSRPGRLDTWQHLAELLDKYHALQIDPVWMPCWEDGHLAPFLPSSLPQEVFKERLRKFQLGGGAREVRRLFQRLERLTWQPDPLVLRLCDAILGKPEEWGEGKETIWPREEVR